MNLAPLQNTQRPVVASKSNALNPMTGQYVRTGPPEFKRFFVVKQIDADYLLCVDEKSVLHYVAMPFALQSYFSHNNGMDYVWGETKISKNANDEEIQWQSTRTIDEERSEVIYPAYTLGEPILAIHFVNDADPSVRWVDINSAGRFWLNASPAYSTGFVKYFRRSLEGEHLRLSWVYAFPALGDKSRIAVLLDNLPDPYTNDTIPEYSPFIEDDLRADYAMASLGNGFSVDASTEFIDQGYYFVPSPDTVGTWITKTREEILALDYFSLFDTSSKTTTDVWQLNNIWHYRGGCFAAINFKDINRAGNGIVVDTEGMIRLDANVPTGSVTGQMALMATGNGLSEFQTIIAPEGGGVDVSSGSLSIDVDVDTIPGEAIVSLVNDEDTVVTAPALYFGNTGDVRGFKLIDSAGGIELNGSDKIALKAIANPTSPTEVSPKSIASDASATEAIYTDTWTAGSTGVKVWVHTRSGYYDSGDEKLYGYRRPFIYDKLGRLYSIGAEVRYEIDAPEEL